VVGFGADLTDTDIETSRKVGNGWTVRADAGLFGGHVRAYAICLSLG
jgi:hypothetical protein